MINRLHAFAVTLVALVGLSGCAAENPVSGQVTFQGQPVQWGFVQFVPDIDKGNDGPTVTVMLTEGGKFSTGDAGKSMVVGEHKVLVSVVTAAGLTPPTVERRFKVSVPEGGTNEFKFDVTPKAVAKGKRFDPETEDA